MRRYNSRQKAALVQALQGVLSRFADRGAIGIPSPVLPPGVHPRPIKGDPSGGLFRRPVKRPDGWMGIPTTVPQPLPDNRMGIPERPPYPIDPTPGYGIPERPGMGLPIKRMPPGGRGGSVNLTPRGQ